MRKRLFGDVTNPSRASAGSVSGIAGRKYPVLLAERLNQERKFRSLVCAMVKIPASDFVTALAGNDVPNRVEGILGAGTKVEPKFKLQLQLKKRPPVNFRMTTSQSSQIHLATPAKFFAEFETRFKSKIPEQVKTALLLFSGNHPEQEKLLDSVPVEYVGDRVRSVAEKKYFNRMTLASMHGYDETIVSAMLDWLAKNMRNLFTFCFSAGAASSDEFAADFMWYADGTDADSPFEIVDLRKIADHLKTLHESDIRDMIHANDAARIGSTVALPFGNLQQHGQKLQFRHNKDKVFGLLSLRSKKRNNFGSKPKLAGHLNEQLIAEALNTDKLFRKHFCDRVGFSEDDFIGATAGGKNAKMEDSVICGKTAGKTDIVVMWKGGYVTNISIKKRTSGQVYLVSARNFAAAFEAQYATSIPSNVKRALELFIGEAIDSRSILDSTDISVDGEDSRSLACEQNFRLVFQVIKSYDAQMANDLISWLEREMSPVVEICFSAGAVKDRNAWAKLLWYKNLVDIDAQGLDYMIPIAKIMSALQSNPEKCKAVPGPRNSGSTIILPFGHLQYHQRQLQFYQKLKSIREIVE